MLKKLIFCIILYTPSTLCFSQFQSKHLTLAATAGVTERTHSNIMHVVVNPKVGYQLNRRVMLITEGHWYRRLKGGDVEEINNIQSKNTYTIGAGARYFVVISPTCGTLFLGSSINQDITNNQTSWFITPGFYLPFKWVTVEISFDVYGKELFQRYSQLFISSEIGVAFQL